MRSDHRRLRRRLRAVALGLAAGALLVPAGALAEPLAGGSHGYADKVAGPSSSTIAAAWGEAANGGAKLGDTPANFPATGSAPVTPKVGDTPADFPDTNGAPEVLVAPITLPKHTIVHEASDVLPLILAGAALLIALATAAYTLRGVLTARRSVVRPSH